MSSCHRGFCIPPKQLIIFIVCGLPYLRHHIEEIPSLPAHIRLLYYTPTRTCSAARYTYCGFEARAFLTSQAIIKACTFYCTLERRVFFFRSREAQAQRGNVSDGDYKPCCVGNYTLTGSCTGRFDLRWIATSLCQRSKV